MCRHATCYNTVGSFTCQCNVGFFDIEENGNCLDVDECLSGVAICPRESECKNTIGSYDCPCIAGHELKTDEISDQEGVKNERGSSHYRVRPPKPSIRPGFTVVT